MIDAKWNVITCTKHTFNILFVMPYWSLIVMSYASPIEDKNSQCFWISCENKEYVIPECLWK